MAALHYPEILRLDLVKGLLVVMVWISGDPLVVMAGPYDEAVPSVLPYAFLVRYHSLEEVAASDCPYTQDLVVRLYAVDVV